MKVICKCCFRPFDYDMYMGLCPKCGRVYRREKGMYSEVERDMVGDFHLHADDGGLNRGIDGVVYNQPGSVAEKNLKNGFDEDMLDRHRYTKPASRPVNQAARPNSSVNQPIKKANQVNQRQNGSQSKTANAANLDGISSADMIEARRKLYSGSGLANGNGEYFAPNHKTQMNKEIVKPKKSTGVGTIFFWIIFIIVFMLMYSRGH